MKSFPRILVIGSLSALGLFASIPANAGDCPTCTTAADCGGNFCVSWDQSPGCGVLTDICCPGQGCAVEDGCPSCFIAGNCTILDGPDTCRQATTSSGQGGGGGAAAGGAPAGGAPPNGGGGNAAGGNGAGASAAGGNGSAGGPGDGGTDATGGASSDGSESDDGCGCAIVGDTRSPPTTALAFALAAILALGLRVPKGRA